MYEGEVVGGFLFPSHEDAAIVVEPRGGALADPAACEFALRAFRDDLGAARADVRSIAAASQALTIGLAIVSEVAAEM